MGNRSKHPKKSHHSRKKPLCDDRGLGKIGEREINGLSFSIYHLTSTIDIGHGLLILFLCFTNGLLAIDFAGQSFHPGAGVYTIGFFQYIVYVYNFEFLAKVV
ncbi:unnamed protein product [Brassica oleracea]